MTECYITDVMRFTAWFPVDARGVVIDSDTYTVHDVTGALKQFFRNLPDPLLTHDLYSEFIATCSESLYRDACNRQKFYSG